jgi:RHS repeat-associated protein
VVYGNHDRMLRYRDAQYAYTRGGELLSKTRGGHVTRYTYDALGNLVAARMPDETQITYPALASDGTDLYVFTGDNFFRIEDDQEYPVFPNKKISAVLSIAGTFLDSDIFVAEYVRDELGRIIEKQENLDRESYVYDNAGRLVRVEQENGLATTFGYDANGNRTHEDGEQVAVYDSHDRMLRYRDAQYAYTRGGELLSKTRGGHVTRYTYDVLGNLVAARMPDETQIAYLIDGANRRIGKKVDGVLVQGFLYQDALNPIAELDGSGNLVSRFIYADRFHVPAYMEKDGVRYRIISDHLGSPRFVVHSQTGEVVQQLAYDTWGKVILDTNPGFQPFGFAGGLHDRDTGLVRFGARDYDPETGRWTAKDPILFAGGDSNLYGYVLNDPVNFVDPYGEAAIAAPAIIGGALLIGAVYYGAKAINETRIALENRRKKGVSNKLPDSIGRIERDGSGGRGDRHAHGKNNDWAINEDGTMHDGKSGRVPKDAADYLKDKGFDIPDDRCPR